MGEPVPGVSHTDALIGMSSSGPPGLRGLGSCRLAQGRGGALGIDGLRVGRDWVVSQWGAACDAVALRISALARGAP